MAQLQEIFESFQCKICMNEYNNTYVPRIVCKNDHITCKICFSRIPGSSCPYCKQRLRENDDYRHLFKIKEATKKVLERQRKYQNEISFLERMVDRLGDENKKLIKFKQENGDQIEQYYKCYKIGQVPKQHDLFEKKFAYFTDKVKQGIQILNVKAKKMMEISNKQAETKIKELNQQIQMQKKISKDNQQELQKIKRLKSYLDSQNQRLKTEISVVKQEKNSLKYRFMCIEDQHKRNLQDIKNKQRESYEQKLKVAIQGQKQKSLQAISEKMIQMFSKSESLECENKDLKKENQELTAEIIQSNEKIQRQRQNYNTKYAQFLSEKLSAQQEFSRLKENMRNNEAQSKDQIDSLKRQKNGLISQKLKILTESKDKQNKLLLLSKLNQSLQKKLTESEAKVEELLREKVSLQIEREQQNENYLAQLQILKVRVIQMNKNIDEDADIITEIGICNQNEKKQQTELKQLGQKCLKIHDQTNKDIADKLQGVLVSCYNQNEQQFGKEQVVELIKSSNNQCRCVECNVQRLSAFLQLKKRQNRTLMEKNHIIQKKNQSLNELSSQYANKIAQYTENMQLIKRQYQQQKQRHEETIKNHIITQQQLEKKIRQLETQLRQKIKENNQLSQQLNASLKAKQDIIKKDRPLEGEIYYLKRQNERQMKRVVKSSHNIRILSSQSQNTSKEQLIAIQQQKLEAQQRSSKANATIVDKLDVCNKQIQQISRSNKDLKANYAKCLQITTSIKQIQKQKNRTKSVHKPLMTNIDEENTNHASKMIKMLSLGLPNQDQNHRNVIYEHSSVQWVRMQSKAQSKKNTQSINSSKLENNAQKTAPRKSNQSHRSITTIIQSQKQKMKAKILE